MKAYIGDIRQFFPTRAEIMVDIHEIPGIYLWTACVRPGDAPVGDLWRA